MCRLERNGTLILCADWRNARRTSGFSYRIFSGSKMSDLREHKKFALVTGASQRVGREIALHLARKGFDIGLHFSNSKEAAERTKKEIESLGRRALLLQANLINPDEIEVLFKCLLSEKTTIDVLINNAAIMPKSDLMKITWQDWDKLMNINLRGVWLLTRKAVEFMKPDGVVINISDAGAEMHWTNYGAYGISKYALNELTRLLAKELAPGIRVCGIAPGLLQKSDSMSQEEWDRLADRVPGKSAGDLEAFLTTLDLLISHGYITGEIITLNGGASLG
jgi:NAD(P)-dependent dehydrogenase (short-subunit alcohol dehydrogenase family)